MQRAKSRTTFPCPSAPGFDSDVGDQGRGTPHSPAVVGTDFAGGEIHMWRES
jgi:hypothetical protein